MLDDPQRVAAEHGRCAAAARDGDASGGMGTLDRRIARVRRGLDRLIDAYAKDLIDASYGRTWVMTM